MMSMKIFMNIIPILLSVAFITLMERKILGITSTRLSPQKVSLMGIIQPLADALKLSNKEINKMSNSSFSMFSMISMIFLFFSMILWTTNTISPSITNTKLSILFIILIMSLNSSLIIFMGWSSYSKFSMMGAMRSAAQTISYEAPFIMIILTVIWLNKSMILSSNHLHNNKLILMIPITFLMILPTSLAEMNRTPFDFSESESELVSGFNTEFGSKEFSMMFLAEYSNIMFLMNLLGFLFFSSMTATMLMIIWVLWIRSVLPRLRFDKLMMMAWKILIPLTTFNLIMCTILT